MAVIALFTGCTSSSGDSTTASAPLSSDSVDAVTSVNETTLTDTTSARAPVTNEAPEATTNSNAGASAPPTVQTSGTAFVVAPDGIDGLTFGASFDEVMTKLVNVHGKAAADTGWVATEVPCDGFGTRQRIVTWGAINVEFSDGPSPYGKAGREHLIATFFGGDDTNVEGVAVTPGGLPLVGAKVSALKGEFAGATVANNELSGPMFTSAAVGGNDSRLRAFLSGLTDDDTVVAFNSGLMCLD
jgi:hypothetical protein